MLSEQPRLSYLATTSEDKKAEVQYIFHGELKWLAFLGLSIIKTLGGDG